MKGNFKVLAYMLLLCVAIVACEKKNDFVDSSDFLGNGVVKSYSGDMVLKWSETTSLAIDTKLPAPAEARVYAMVSIAMHDALNNVYPMFHTYALDNSGTGSKEVTKKTVAAISDAAVSQAAHDVLVSLFTSYTAKADSVLQTCLEGIDDSESKDLGIEIGKSAALAVQDKRASDTGFSFSSYPQGTIPGEYRSTMPYAVAFPPVWPDNAVYGATLGNLSPFGVMAGNQFPASAPYSINSPEYTADYDEVKSIGSNTSAVRTAEQTADVIFFTDNMPSMINRVARYVAISEGLGGWDAARLLALTNMVQIDAIICGFHELYFYNFWRPFTAIREGNNDGNEDTEGDAGWNAVTAARAIPPLPAYPSTYAVAGRGGVVIISEVLGKPVGPVVVGSYSAPNEQRTYNDIAEVGEIMGLSRLYGGHNFRHDIEEGNALGEKIASYVFQNNLRPIK
ncbi:vanadium-dependent haloperoxidase [Mangrovibacterium diazotrophicum]|uniref:PAP2 superfamily protein n=1 Tax=Mangrovibacterium diazotrophicum TaxID=1261403 RepID=A0A419WA01_9BACT|nr:vanadium-dependent haloperoxidase [Mangrovibacterium diazotrophicum]RKD92232.1 PAP2 superfamily protein [Mangrovibacterium diazotrophicum]